MHIKDRIVDFRRAPAKDLPQPRKLANPSPNRTVLSTPKLDNPTPTTIQNHRTTRLRSRVIYVYWGIIDFSVANSGNAEDVDHRGRIGSIGDNGG